MRSLAWLRHPNFVAYLDWFAGPNGLDREVYLVPSSTFEDVAATTAVLNAEVMEFCPFSLADMIFVAGAFQSHTQWTMTVQPKLLD